MGITYAEIVKEYEGATKYPIVLVMKDGKLRELHKRLKQDGTLEFITTADEIGHKTYKRSAILLLLKALYNVAGHDKIKKQLSIMQSVRDIMWLWMAMLQLLKTFFWK